MRLSAFQHWPKIGLAFCLLAVRALALDVSLITSTNFFYDSGSTVACNYVQYAITNNSSTALDNLWVKIDTLSGPNITLGYGGSGLHNLGKLGANALSTEASFYLRTTNLTKNLSSTETHVVRIYQGYPGAGGVQLFSKTFSLTFADISVNQSYKVSSVSYTPLQPVVGATFKVNVVGTLTGGLKVNDAVTFIPASTTNWNVGAFDFLSATVYLTNNSVLVGTTNVLAFKMPVAADSYRVEYTFRATSVTTTNTPVSPDFAVKPSSSWVHSDVTGVTIPTVLPPTNSVVLTNFANVTQRYTNEPVTFTVRFSNSGGIDTTIDQVIDTLPAGFAYVTNSTLFNGSAAPDPLISGVTNTWSEPLVVPAGLTRDLVFQALAGGTNTTVTNAVVAYVGTTLIDSTVATGDNSPAKSSVRVLWGPTAVNDTGSLLEDATLSVAGPGVLSNDTEPNGFTMTVASYTQPAHGTVTVGSNGSFLYTPVTNYFGNDSFSYTLTNGNARSTSASVALTVTAVNDAPGFTKGADQELLPNAGAQTIASWATSISPGGANEDTQKVTFHVSNNNNALFAVQPSVSTNGTLTFTPAANATGSATVGVYLADDGGTANGGIDTSGTQTFLIRISPINTAPAFTKGTDQSVLEDAGAQTVAGWATGISAGTGDEGTQVLTFHVSNDNHGLFATQPAVAANGTLSYKPAANANGSATVSVYLQDDGGTANGGVDTSGTQTFAITVTSVNDAPSFTAGANQTVSQNAGAQTVANWATAISAGPSDESAQVLTFQISNDNSTLFATQPAVAADGTLTFTPATNATGTATVSLVLKDDGGTDNGGADTSATQTFVIAINLPSVWTTNGTYRWTINQADGVAGGNPGWQLQSVTGALTITADSTNRFTLELVTLALPANGTGPMTHFDPTKPYSWPIIEASDGIVGFDPDRFLIDTNGFANDLAGGTLALTQVGNTLQLVFSPASNHAPTAASGVAGTRRGQSLTISAAKLLAKVLDVDSDTLSLTGVSASTLGGAASLSSGVITYTPPSDFEGEDLFTYSVSDGHGGAAAAIVTVNVTSNPGANVIAAVYDSTPEPRFTIKFAGIPGATYRMQVSADMHSWVDLPGSSVVVETSGHAVGTATFVEVNVPAPIRFYRTVYVSGP